MENPAYSIKISCENDIEVLTAMVQLYSVSIFLRNGKKLRSKLAQLVSYYIKYGYTKDTKLLAAESMDTSTYNINVMNSELTKLGYLITSTTNYHDKFLNPELKILSNYYKSPEKTKFMVFSITNKST